MIQFICLFCPSFISLAIHMMRNRKEKNNGELVIYYFLYTLLNYFIMSGLLYFGFNRNELDYTLSFSEKYILLSSVIAFHLPLVFDLFKNIIKKFITKYYEIYDKFIISNLKKLKDKIKNTKIVKAFFKYLKNNKQYIKDNILFIILVTLQFLLLDIVIRTVIYKDIAFYQIYMLTPNMLTVAYGLLVGIILVLLPKILSKILFIIISLFNIVLFIVNYMMLLIKSEAFTVYNFQIAGEGFEYISFIFEKISILFILIILIFIALLIITWFKYKKVTCDLKVPIRIIIFVAGILTFFAIRFVGVGILQDYRTPSGWADITFPKYYTDHLINSRKNVSVLGMYEYTLRDITNYVKNSTETFGSVEEIDKIIENSTIKTEENDKTGIFEGKNLIMIMMESIDNVVVDEDTMPTLNMMKNEGWNFTKRYSQLNSGGSTIATEYTTLSGLYYTYDNKYDVNAYNESIPSVFANNNYNVSSFHENKGVYYNRVQLHKSLGFTNSYFLGDMNYNVSYYEDAQFFNNDELYNLVVPKNSEEPFMSFLITIAAHGPYTNNTICMENGIEDENACLRYLSKRTDDMLASMLNRLEKDGILDDTVIVLYSDHTAYSYNYTEDELKNTYEKVDESYSIKNLPFIIYNPELDAELYDKIIVNDTDFAPTIFNLFGIDYEAEYYVGTDIFSENHRNVCIFKDYSWYDGTIYSMNASQNEYFIETSNYVKDRLDFSQMLVSNNYYKNINN